jgi:hypothetical protein
LLQFKYYAIAARADQTDPLTCLALAEVLWNEELDEYSIWLSEAKRLAAHPEKGEEKHIVLAWERRHKKQP